MPAFRQAEQRARTMKNQPWKKLKNESAQEYGLRTTTMYFAPFGQWSYLCTDVWRSVQKGRQLETINQIQWRRTEELNKDKRIKQIKQENNQQQKQQRLRKEKTTLSTTQNLPTMRLERSRKCPLRCTEVLTLISRQSMIRVVQGGSNVVLLCGALSIHTQDHLISG